jgi:hypothetical protein
MAAITRLGLHGTPTRKFAAVTGGGGGGGDTWPVLPIVHGLPQIEYNGTFINFPVDVYQLEIEQEMYGLSNRSASGTSEYLSVNLDIGVLARFRGFLDANPVHAALRLQIEQLDMWAKLKLPWTFARDRGEKIITTLSSAVPAGAMTVAVSSTDYIQPLSLYVIRSKVAGETVKVASVDSASQITLTTPLINDYEAGDRFRSRQFWPCRLEDGYHSMIVEKPEYHGFEIAFYADESVDDL